MTPSRSTFVDGPPPGADRLLSVVELGPVTDSQPSAARSRAEQASKATRFFLKFLRDILSTSFETIRRAVLSQPRCREMAGDPVATEPAVCAS